MGGCPVRNRPCSGSHLDVAKGTLDGESHRGRGHKPSGQANAKAGLVDPSGVLELVAGEWDDHGDRSSFESPGEGSVPTVAEDGGDLVRNLYAHPDKEPSRDRAVAALDRASSDQLVTKAA